MGLVLDAYGEGALMVCRLDAWREGRRMWMLGGDGGLLILGRRNGWVSWKGLGEPGRSDAGGKSSSLCCEFWFGVERRLQLAVPQGYACCLVIWDSVFESTVI